eukprot:7244415-Alexandrium_andersonii.AAC.1
MVQDSNTVTLGPNLPLRMPPLDSWPPLAHSSRMFGHSHGNPWRGQQTRARRPRPAEQGSGEGPWPER